MNSIVYLEGHPYPAPARGRYARWLQKESWRSPGDPLWRIGCVWSEAPPEEWFPGDDYCECVELEPEWGRVLIGWGSPPRKLPVWLPAEWPAGLFPLGVTREHLRGWRGLVLAAVSYLPERAFDYRPQVRWAYPGDVVAADDWECGWRALIRASRALAFHYGLITNDRLYAPYPATQHLSRPDVEPLLDGLVQFAGETRAAPAGAPSAPAAEGRPSAAGAELPPQPRWDADARTLYFGTRPVKRYDRHPADTQLIILAAFEAAGWPSSVEPELGDVRKQDALKALNASLGSKSPITFHGNGTANGIRWQPRPR